MIKLLIILLFPFTACAQVLGFGGIIQTAPPPVDTIPFFGRTTVFCGNSITLGVAASPMLTNRWTTLFSTAKGTTEVNNGVSGMTMQSGGCGSVFSNGYIPTYNSGTHAALIICLGINDVGNNIPALTAVGFKTAYQSALTNATVTKGWPPARIVLITPYWAFTYNAYVGSCSVSVAADLSRQTAYNTVVSEVATEYGTKFIDIYTPMKAALDATYYNADQLHPNNTGHAWIASYLNTVIL
jgi:lysophospholipase L1-like esterase